MTEPAERDLTKLRRAFLDHVNELDELRYDFIELVADVAEARAEAVEKEKRHWQKYYDNQFNHIMTCELNVKSTRLDKAALEARFAELKAAAASKKAHESAVDTQIKEKTTESEKLAEKLRRMKAFVDARLEK
uniref:Flagellar export protein FliJ n=1 Tax=Panagrellus redivivus TaxID=6233 RepID=A0A7E4VHE2_PANRE